MSESGLYAVETATIDWQNSTQDAQQTCASTVDLEASWLMQIYQDAQKQLTSKMNAEPKASKHSTKTFATDVQEWQAEYNELSQKWQNLENQWNTPIQSGDQDLQTLGNAAQQASQMASTVSQPNNITANLLQAQL